MKAIEILEFLKHISAVQSAQTIDTVKAGDGEKEVGKAAVCFIATPQVIKDAHKWGADLLITHEPTYHDNFDYFGGSEIEKEKRALIESTGMTIFRFHDHAHSAVPDLIHAGFLKTLGLKGVYSKNRYFDLETPVSPLELARFIEEKAEILHVRIAGGRNFKAKRIALYLGACGDVALMPLKNGEAEIVVCGEVCEWKCCEFVRDAAELGHNMAILVTGHEDGERDGMKYITEIIKNKLNIESKYFESGEVYTYTD